MKRGSKLEREVSVSELLEMRKTMSVAEIASSLDVSIGTVYRYIGKKSVLIAQAAQQNKPSPIPVEIDPIEEHPKEEAKVFKAPEKKEPEVRPIMKVLREHVVRDLQGSVCVFHIDTGSNTIELKDEGGSTVTGILALDDIPLFMAELDHVYKTVKKAV